MTWRNKCKIPKGENGENVPYLESTEVLLVNCNIANNNCQQDARVLCDLFPINFLAIYQNIERLFTDQNSAPLQLEHKTNITLVIN